MSNVVFILGAGASKEAGAPLMADFLDVAWRLWKAGRVNDYAAKFEEVFRGISSLQVVHSKSQLDFDNIESVFAAFEMGKILKRLPGVKVESIDSRIESLKTLIGATIEETMMLPVGAQRPKPPVPYRTFVEMVKYLRTEATPHRTVSIITFNYDLACDYALYHESVPIDYALEGYPGMEAVPLLKLHGSLNWVYCPKLEKVVPWSLSSLLEKHHSDSLVKVNDQFYKLKTTPILSRFEYQSNSVIPEPVLVPPTWNKSEHHRNLSDVWSRAAKELSDAEDIFIIGYSLPATDSFFRYLYALGTVGETLLKRLWVFNPDNRVEERFRTMLGSAALARFQFVHEKFAPSLGTIKRQFPKQQ